MLHSFISIYGWEPALWFGLSVAVCRWEGVGTWKRKL